MKKQVLSLLTLLIMFSGCALNGSYTKKILKTESNKIVVCGTLYEDKKNNKTLPGTVSSEDHVILASADRDGKYRIELPRGIYTLRATFVGYKVVSAKKLNLVRGDSVVLDFALKESFEKTTNW